jgi:triosephosphate isomerase
MRTPIVAGNWKMNKDLSETKSLLSELVSADVPSNVEIVVAPSFVVLESAVNATSNSTIAVAAQNVNAAANGAFTGETSLNMLGSIGVNQVILGHSERRDIYGETDEIINKKVIQSIEAGFRVIFCFGEQLSERKEGSHFNVVSEQLSLGLKGVTDQQMDQIVLAYEPVWAIGTGETATPEQAQEMHSHIRSFLSDAYSTEVASKVRILYGGSVKPGNAKYLFANPDIDGGLIGGASLVASDFLAIVAAAE